MTFRKNQCCLSSTKLRFLECSIKPSIQFGSHFSFEEIVGKLKNSICFILQTSEHYEMTNNTKYIALSIFQRFLSPEIYFNEENLKMLKLCSLRLAVKSNEASPKSVMFDAASFIESIGISRSLSEILQFEFQLFCQLNFNPYVKSPFQFTDQLVKTRNLPESYSNAINCYIDLALTLIELIGYTPEEIFAGCLVALKKTRKLQNKTIVGLIQEICERINKGYQIGDIIIQNYQNLLESSQQ